MNMKQPIVVKTSILLLVGAAALALFASPVAAAPCLGELCVVAQPGGACLTQGRSDTQTWTCAGTQGVCRFFWSDDGYSGADCVVFISGGEACILVRDDGEGNQSSLACVP